ncbi:MAG: hypothetical protein NT151_01305 [Acidobacteria bacterium]|nr:hypothetical protein [Acidobacteriota bacterium]
MSSYRMPGLVQTALVVSLLLAVPHIAFGQGGFVGPSSGGPATGTVNAGETQLTYNGTTYPLVNGRVTFPDCTMYIALRSGMLIPGGMAAGCTPGGGSGGGGGFVGPGTGGPATGSVSGNLLTYNSATYTRVNGKVTFPDCTLYIAMDSGLLIPAGTAPGCAPAVVRTTPTITWATPASVVAGTVLGGTQLNATANVQGTFAYSPAAGTVLTAGTQTLSTTFTPTDTTNYATATATVTIVVTASGGGSGGGGFAGPASGGPSSGEVSGNILTYNGGRFTIVNGKVTFPDCTVYIATSNGALIRYGVASPCTPGKVTLDITWLTPASVAPGTALSATQLNATAPTAGTFVYNPPAGTVLQAGTTTLSVTFTPTDTVTYATSTATVTIQVISSGGMFLGPGSGGPATGQINGNILTYSGATYTIVNGKVQLPDCFIYIAGPGGLLIRAGAAASCSPSSGGGGGGSGGPSGVPGAGPIQTWSAPKQVVNIGRVSIFGMGMAYDAATKRYLLAWRASTNACGGADAVWGQFLDSNADPLGSPFLVSIGSNCMWAYSGWEPAVAATGDGRFMVTYARNNPSATPSPYSVIFHLVEYNGVPQLAAPVTIDNGTSHEATAVAWMPHAQQFMVMWSKNGPPRGTKVIWSMAITRDGGLAQIYQVTDKNDFIDMATAKIAQGADNNLLVIGWRDSTNSAMAPNGGISYTQVNEGGSPLMNTGNIVGPSTSFYRYTRVAYNSQTQKYLAIYTDYAYPGCDPDSPSGGNVMARNFNLNGTPMESGSYALQSTNRCNGAVGDDQFTELGLAYEPVNNAFVIGARGQDNGNALPVYRMVTDPNGKVYQSSVNQQSAENASPMPTIVADGAGRVLIAYRPNYTSIWVMFGSK